MDISRKYFSYSQYNTWKTSPKEYYKKYVLDNKYKSTKYQQFGKDLMYSLEFDDGKVDKIPKVLLAMLTNYDFEEEINIWKETIGSQKNLLSFVDCISYDKKSFIEIKTGKHPWTQDMVNKDEQVLFYAMAIYLKYGFVASSKLIWVETTELEDGSIEFTGNVKVFYRKFSISEIEKFQAKVLKAIVDIKDYDYTVISFDADLDSKLLALISEKKRIDNELEVLKSEMLISLIAEDTKYGVTENFNITKSSRSSWTYSDELTARIKENTSDLKKFKTEEEKNGTATKKESEYLLIKTRS